MNSLSELSPRLMAMSDQSVEAVRKLEKKLGSNQQIPIRTSHLLHGQMYARTVCLPAGAALTGALLKLATILIVHGDCVVFTGDGEIHLSGFNVIPGSAGRKTAFIAYTDTHMTMVFPSIAKTVEEAENQFTEEAHLLISRRDGSSDTITITGE